MQIVFLGVKPECFEILGILNRLYHFSLGISVYIESLLVSLLCITVFYFKEFSTRHSKFSVKVFLQVIPNLIYTNL